MSENGSRITDALKRHGFDIAHFFDVDLVNGLVPSAFIEGSRAGVLIGNTRALWPPFAAHLKRSGANSEAPLDDYTEKCVSDVLKEFPTTALKYAHHLEPEPLPVQRICAVIGFAAVSPMGLNVHAQYGPWFALRAVALFDFPITPSRPEDKSPCHGCTRPCEPPFREAVQRPGEPRRFLAARRACPVGREHVYSAEQIAHHYDRNPLLKQS